MRTALALPVELPVALRRASPTDVDALLALENAAFAVDRMSRRSLRHFMASAGAVLTIAEDAGELAGYSLTLFPPRAACARLYSIAVASPWLGCGIGAHLLASAESEARARRRAAMRLEVHVANRRAIACYVRSGYRRFGTRRGYYDDGGDAWRFEKPLYPP